MTALNKQALTSESARESGNILLIVAARMARRELFTPLHFVSELPQKVVSMRVFREALEKCEETLQCEVCKIVDGHDRMAKKLKEAESKLEAAEKRIAELQIARDKCFKSGLKTGWEYGIADDTEGYNREISDAQAVIDRAAGIQVIEGEQKNG